MIKLENCGRIKAKKACGRTLVSYTYDLNGNKKSVTDATGKRTCYEYDADGRYAGIRVSVGENVISDIRYGYDDKGDCIKKANDADGNMTSDGRGIYKYDSMNRMVEAVMEDGIKLICRYDAEGLRHETEENGRLIKFIYSGRDVVCEEDEESVTRYIRGNGRLVASDSEQARTYYHYACDSLGSVSHVIAGDEFGSEEENADIGRRVLCRYEYDAFGNTVSEEENVTNRYGFAGEMRDGVTGQYYLRARYYVPEIGRFTQADTYHGDGLNLYVYARNNPVKYVDPSGHNSKGNDVESSDTELNYILFNKTHKDSLPKPKGTGPNGGRLQSHHGLQKQWANANLSQYGYDESLAPTITIETGKEGPYPHTKITNAQNARRDARQENGQGKWSSSLQDELSYIVTDMKSAGFSNATIEKVLQQQYSMLDKLGVSYERIDINEYIK